MEIILWLHNVLQEVGPKVLELSSLKHTGVYTTKLYLTSVYHKTNHSFVIQSCDIQLTAWLANSAANPVTIALASGSSICRSE